MSTWVRFKHQEETQFGVENNGVIHIYQGDMFNAPTLTDACVALERVELLTPCQPTKLLGLWNNFNATAEKTGLPHPQHPWYFSMTPNSYAGPHSVIRRPATCEGKILFEGELGVVIGRTCKETPANQVQDYIFGFTCVNDVTALEHLFSEEQFSHWTRAKNFDGFGVFGPCITTDIDPFTLSVKTFLENGDQVQERQNYPVNDMLYSPYEAVSKISYDMTLQAGDIIACGTSIGAGALKHGWTVRVCIDGVGELINTYSEC